MTWWTAFRVSRLEARLAKLRRKAEKQAALLLKTQEGINAALVALGVQLHSVNSMATTVAKVMEHL